MNTHTPTKHLNLGMIPALLATIVVILLTASNATAADDADKNKLALDVATLFRAARAVISDNQALINDAEKGDKGLSAAVVIAGARANYQKATGKELSADTATLAGQAQSALLGAINEVMEKAQPLINEKGKGFKGFLPAVFGKQVADATSRTLEGKIFIKLTAPAGIIRNRANRPDEWEAGVLESKFKAADWTKGKEFSEPSTHKGKPGYRLLIPEYYGESCLKCHGGPKGERDISGGLKEGLALGDLGGAISVVVY